MSKRVTSTRRGSRRGTENSGRSALAVAALLLAGTGPVAAYGVDADSGNGRHEVGDESHELMESLAAFDEPRLSPGGRVTAGACADAWAHIGSMPVASGSWSEVTTSPYWVPMRAAQRRQARVAVAGPGDCEGGGGSAEGEALPASGEGIADAAADGVDSSGPGCPAKLPDGVLGADDRGPGAGAGPVVRVPRGKQRPPIWRTSG